MNMAVIRGIIEAGLPQQHAKSKDIASRREFAVITAIDLKKVCNGKWSEDIGGCK